MVNPRSSNNKRRKFHDKDKYYRLAKEQGLRSRAAFKLSQINRKFQILEKATTVLDLCAAPGGWTQIASKACKNVVAVDIIPIRPLGPHVTTLVGDITTDSCKAEIKRTLQGNRVQVVLHDGAPQVGASYDRDAYQQNEISLHALRCATQHLGKGGSFITKLYRSRDYQSYVWVAQQLFDKVQAVKPSASRLQSAEIFLVCQNYHDFIKIDARLLDPKHVFSQVEGGDSTGGGSGSNNKKLNVFTDKHAKRQRNGYDMTNVDATFRNILPVSQWIEQKGDAIGMLSEATAFKFTEKCKFYLQHPATTLEIKECVTDLKVLGKSDFKGLLLWRTKMQIAIKAKQEAEKDKDQEEDGDDEEHGSTKQDSENVSSDEEAIQEEIAEMRRRRARFEKKLKKKQRAAAGKRRKRAALGMELNAIDVPEHDQIFTLASITSAGQLEAARHVDLGTVTDKDLNIQQDEDENEQDDEEEEDVVDCMDKDGHVFVQDNEDEVTGYNYRLEQELDQAYDRYLETTKSAGAKAGTKMAKRSKKALRQKAELEAQQDADMMLLNHNNNHANNNDNNNYYAKMLGSNTNHESEDESESEDDGFFDTPHDMPAAATPKRKKNPLVYELPEDPVAVKASRWFSNPLFESIGTTAKLAVMGGSKRSNNHHQDLPPDNDDDDSDTGHHQDADKNGAKHHESNDDKNSALTADEVLALMPKTDKQIRHERRVKAMERKERKLARRAKKAGEADADFEVVQEEEEQVEDALTDAQRAKIQQARNLIKAGMGNKEASQDAINDDDDYDKMEIVSDETTEPPLPIMDHRKYDSEHEDYDSDDYAETLALGTMMLRRSKAKALVDASYNRYAWNDPSDLPDWFVDDENRHYRPQLPIPPALVAKMKAKMVMLSEKPIAKVAEARARKNKRARAKLVAAKKTAQAVAHSSDMTEAMKLKAISKAMRNHHQDSSHRGRQKVVSKKGGGFKTNVRGAKMVDKRMKSDTRGMERAEKKRKGGGKAGGRSKKKRR